MRCNPSFWLWGLPLIALLSWIVVQFEHEGIEADLGRRTQEALARKGFDWAVANYSGRDADLSGKAIDDSEPGRALAAVRDTWGVRVVNGRTELLPVIEKRIVLEYSRDL